MKTNFYQIMINTNFFGFMFTAGQILAATYSDSGEGCYPRITISIEETILAEEVHPMFINDALDTGTLKFLYSK